MSEIWKDIPGYEGLYQINNSGQIISLRSGKLRKDVQSGHGYRAIQLSDYYHTKKRFYVHRLVAIAFLGNPPTEDCVVNHKNLIKRDNRVENLEWTTVKGNTHHAYINGKNDFRRQMRVDNKTGIKGVHQHSGGYQVSLNGKYIGWYKSLESAAKERTNAETEALKCII
jgi:hypothetical protein